MKTSLKILFSALLALSASFAQAGETPSDPCEPTVRAKPSYLSCRDEKLSYWVQINTMMSGPACPFAKHVEVSTATIEISDRATEKKIGTLTLNPGAFQYRLGSGDGWLKSESLSLDLERCVSPMDGGLSAGN